MTSNEPNETEKSTSEVALQEANKAQVGLLDSLLRKLSLDTLNANWPHDKQGYIKAAMFHVFVEQKVFEILKALYPLNFELDESGESLRIETGRFQLIIFGEEPGESESTEVPPTQEQGS